MYTQEVMTSQAMADHSLYEMPEIKKTIWSSNNLKDKILINIKAFEVIARQISYEIKKMWIRSFSWSWQFNKIPWSPQLLLIIELNEKTTFPCIFKKFVYTEQNAITQFVLLLLPRYQWP